jgi:DNA polymerase I-like protein with 3'-5' exonuclease and polymerase domains
MPAILKPVLTTPRPYSVVNLADHPLDTWLPSLLTADPEPLVLDLETTGLHPRTARVVGFALANSTGSTYFHIGESAQALSMFYELCNQLDSQQVPLIAHNVAFDSCWLPESCYWVFCTYAGYKHLASEGYAGQKWDLKSAQVEMLGWEDKGDTELVAWLDAHKLTKADMWRAPKEILGKYCALDAESTWQLYTHVLLPAVNKFQAYKEYHRAFLDLVFHVREMRLEGVHIDNPQLTAYNQELQNRIKEKRTAFLMHPSINPHVTGFNKQVYLEEVEEKEPAKFKKGDELGNEPAKFKKDGGLSQNWVKWDARRQELENKVPEVSQTWLNWEKKKNNYTEGLTQHVNTEPDKDLGLFNLQSSRHKQWLFYEALGYPKLVFTDNEDNPQPAVDEDALKGFGEEGKLLIDLNADIKLQSMVQGCLDLLGDGNFLRVGLKCPGTYTGRCGGADGLNLQNVPKDKGYLSCWTPPPDHKLLILDFSALEPHVLAEASQDPTLLRIYGPDATGWDDIYLSVGSRLGGEVGARIRASGYDPFNNSKESVSHSKKEAKAARQIAKMIHLGASYGAGAGKIQQSLKLEGIDISFDEAKRMHTAYWELFSKVKQYETFLKIQWERNGGWFLNPMGRPIAVAQDYLRDIVNRSIQSGGHDAFLLYLNILSDKLRSQSVPYKPYIWDLHDAVMLTVPESDVEEAVHILDVVAMDELNARLGGTIRLKGVTNVVNNWAEDKE